ncbi:MAG: bifunctional adenosylcobinamide kinase/adenosylcobinamide-phosphate guanylyltransferase [Roseburia sp.]
MIHVIIGGSASGKSAYAEELACSLGQDKSKYYVATMEAYGAEGAARVKKHRNMRRGKGFCTIEKLRDIGALARQKRLEGSVILLECISNLVANEMFASQSPLPPDQIPEQILSGIRSLAETAEHLIVVTNDVFGDGISYDDTTMTYIRTLGTVNQMLSATAQQVTEVVYSIPCRIV